MISYSNGCTRIAILLIEDIPKHQKRSRKIKIRNPRQHGNGKEKKGSEIMDEMQQRLNLENLGIALHSAEGGMSGSPSLVEYSQNTTFIHSGEKPSLVVGEYWFRAQWKYYFHYQPLQSGAAVAENRAIAGFQLRFCGAARGKESKCKCNCGAASRPGCKRKREQLGGLQVDQVASEIAIVGLQVDQVAKEGERK